MQRDSTKCNVYLFPGQGSDERVFEKINLSSEYNMNYISYPVPGPGQSLEKFAHRFIPLIDTSGRYVLIGYSLGGMICTELTDVLQPEKTVIISSAKSIHELPTLYTLQSKIPVHKIVPASFIKAGAMVLQPIVEPDRKKEKGIFKDMLKSKDPLYLKRTSEMIINWKRIKYPKKIIHVHGDADNTIPIKNVKYNYQVKNGSHMMILTRAEEISKLIHEIIVN